MGFDIETLTVTVLIDTEKTDISFDSPVGYRVLDDSDLFEFWSSCSSTKGWLYEITSGVWLDQERQHKEFFSTSIKEMEVLLLLYIVIKYQ